ncbi:uncharacterized protein (TIGR02679 family) [Actinoplanes tereljensis]|uniref:TIGR02679 family protein n=1 Tax=Paractinoplanes tereljensis TaxID=571912 RepID=A0A919NWN1_9ACTN|nr:TIGR02679 family protein [Actinoplanes tereljensis]GIF26686.1 hypothetical protein Ate02nite_94160 [Actinoplanes tereljensis]
MIPASVLLYLGSPWLMPLWTSAHDRLSRNGRVASGRVTLASLSPSSRDAIGHLLNQVVGETHRVDLAVVDRLLSASAAGTGLLDVVSAVVGPVPDRRADASAARAHRSLLRDQVAASLAVAGLADRSWAPAWVDLAWRHGPSATVALGLTIGAQARTWSRGELAQAVTGTAHGLDDDTPLTRLVLRGLALALTGAADYPAGAAERRALWDLAGVAGDTVATTVLTYGLRPAGDEWLRHRAGIGAETHLTLREIRRLAPLRLPPQTVYVCENPRVLEAAADAGARAAVICTMGNPTTVTLALLDVLVASPEVKLAYHGDFDWPGVAIAGRVMGRFGASPWRFCAEDYRRAVTQTRERGTPSQALSGAAVETSWNPALAAAMGETGIAIHEEAVIDELINDLEPRAR